MKAFIRFSALCLITGIVISSCSPNLSVTKRHYNKGYYVAHRDNKPSATAEKQPGELSAIQKQHSTPASTTDNALNTQPDVTQNRQVSRTTTNAALRTKGASKSPPSSATQNRPGQFMRHPIKTIGEHTARLKPVRMLHEKMSRSSDDDALSLFWIVILILLILWAVGLLSGGFGLGGLINILLVIALILLILWLLRVL